MRIEDMTIKEKREQIGLCLAKLKNNSRRSISYISEEDDKNNLNNCMYYIEQIDVLTKDCTPEELQEILGGEFEKDYLNDMPMNVAGTQIPAYFFMDMAAMFIGEGFMSRNHTKDAATEVLNKLANIREKAVVVEYNKLFDPEKTLSPHILEFFKNNKRFDFYVDVNIAEGIRHLEIELRSVSEEGLYKNGEIYDSNVARSTTKFELYEEDRKKLKY